MSSSGARAPRKFLVVIDKTPESVVALRFATRRAQHTGGRITLMCPTQLPDFQQWRGVEEIMRDEAHAEAEGMLYEAAKVVNELSGIVPELLFPSGSRPTVSPRSSGTIRTSPSWCWPPEQEKKVRGRWCRCSPRRCRQSP